MIEALAAAVAELAEVASEVVEAAGEIGKEVIEKAAEAPKEIGKAIESKADVPKEINEGDIPEKRVPKEIGETTESVKDIPKEIGKSDVSQKEAPKEIGSDPDDNPDQTETERKINASFESNGYKYETDELGRTKSVEGKLQRKDHTVRNKIKPSMSEIGKGYEKTTDEKGHLIADRFNGPGNLENIVPQDANLNRGEYKKLENQWAERVNVGDDVRVRIEPQYSGDSFRPDSFNIRYSINGEQFTKTFSNG